MTTTTATLTQTENIAEAKRIIKAHKGIITVSARIPEGSIEVIISKKEALGYYLEAAVVNGFGIRIFKRSDDEIGIAMEEASEWDRKSFNHPLS